MSPTVRPTILLATLLALPALLSAQRPAPHLRAVAGVTAAQLNVAGASTDALFGFSLGAQGIMPVTERFAVVPEFLLVEKGGLDRINGSDAGVDIRSFDLSILARWDFDGPRGAQAHLVAGPTVGYLLACVAGAAAPGRTLVGECTANIHRTDAGLSAGAGLDFVSNGVDWGVELRYQHGLADIRRAPGAIQTRTWQLLFNYRP